MCWAQWQINSYSYRSEVIELVDIFSCGVDGRGQCYTSTSQHVSSSSSSSVDNDIIITADTTNCCCSTHCKLTIITRSLLVVTLRNITYNLIILTLHLHTVSVLLTLSRSICLFVCLFVYCCHDASHTVRVCVWSVWEPTETLERYIHTCYDGVHWRKERVLNCCEKQLSTFTDIRQVSALSQS